jgi:hypothetical protein
MVELDPAAFEQDDLRRDLIDMSVAHAASLPAKPGKG